MKIQFTLYKNLEIHFLHKTNTFSYDENVNIIFVRCLITINQLDIDLEVSSFTAFSKISTFL